MIKNVSSFIPEQLLAFGRLWNKVNIFINDLYAYYLGRIKSIKTLYDPGETELIYELSQLVGAYITSYDSDRVIHDKTANAIFTHQHVSIFDEVWKPIIDGVLGGNSSIYSGLQYYGSFVVGQSIIGSPSKIGPVIFPNGLSANKLPGQVFIDLDVSPNTNQLNEIVSQLRPLAVQYFNIYLGNTSIVDSNYFVVGLSTIGGIDLIGEDMAPLVIFQSKVKL